MNEREIVRCRHCHLNQFVTANGNCRRCRFSFIEKEPIIEAAPAVAAPVPVESVPVAFDIATAVKLLRTAQHMSQGDLSENTGMFRTYISKVERGDVIPNLGSLAKLADGLNLPTSALVQIAAGLCGIAA